MTGSISVSGQLPNYPSPNPTLTLTCCQLIVVELGEGWVGSCSDTDIDPDDLRGFSPYKYHGGGGGGKKKNQSTTKYCLI